MPGKKKKKGSAKPPPPSPPRPPPAKLTETSKEFYLIQITDLEQRLIRYQKRCDELEAAKQDSVAKYENLKMDKNAIIELLQGQDKKKAEEIADLSDRVQGLNQTQQMEKEQYKTQINNLHNELDQVRVQLTSENMILNGKLASLEEFRMQKDDLMEQLAMMENKLITMDAHYKENICELDKKQSIDKDRLKKEMFVRVNQLVAEFQEVTDKQMGETTKRMIRENLSITSKMAKMSDKTMTMIEENDALKAKEKTLLSKLNILEHNEKELIKKNLSTQKVINMLMEKSHDLQNQVENHQKSSQSLEYSLKAAEKKIAELQNDSAALKEQKSRTEQIIRDAAEAIKDVVSNVKISEDDEDALARQVSQTETMLQHLLLILNSSEQLGERSRSTSAKLGKQAAAAANKEKAIPEKLKKVLLPPIAPPTKGNKSSMVEYTVGDLGLVPRLTQQIPTNLEKMRLSRLQQQDTLRKRFSRSVGTQTISAAKTLFFAEKMLTQASLAGKNPLHDMVEFLKGDTESPSTIDTPPVITTKISLTNKAC